MNAEEVCPLALRVYEPRDGKCQMATALEAIDMPCIKAAHKLKGSTKSCLRLRPLSCKRHVKGPDVPKGGAEIAKIGMNRQLLAL